LWSGGCGAPDQEKLFKAEAAAATLAEGFPPKLEELRRDWESGLEAHWRSEEVRLFQGCAPPAAAAAAAKASSSWERRLALSLWLAVEEPEAKFQDPPDDIDEDARASSSCG
jgi:hypothetical protein